MVEETLKLEKKVTDGSDENVKLERITSGGPEEGRSPIEPSFTCLRRTRNGPII